MKGNHFIQIIRTRLGVLQTPSRIGRDKKDYSLRACPLCNIPYANLNHEKTVKYGSSNLNYIAYADDQVILAKTEYKLQEKLNNLHTSMKTFGLEINPKKCKCVHLKINRKVKTYYIATKIVVDGERIPNLNANEN